MASRETPRHARSVDALGSMSLRQHSIESLLQAVADSAKLVMPGIPRSRSSCRTANAGSPWSRPVSWL